MKIDFHVHTRRSPDSIIKVADLARKSTKLGIIPSLADHNSIKAHADMRATGAPFVPAEEVFTDRGDLVGLYVNEQIPKGTSFLETIDIIHGQGGLAYLPHMFDYGRSGRHVSGPDAAKVDIVEVFNARCLDQDFNRKAKGFAESHKLPQAAGTDSHFLFEFGSTYVDMPGLDELDDSKALLRALKSNGTRLITRPAPPYARGTTTIISFVRRKLLRQ